MHTAHRESGGDPKAPTDQFSKYSLMSMALRLLWPHSPEQSLKGQVYEGLVLQVTV